MTAGRPALTRQAAVDPAGRRHRALTSGTALVRRSHPTRPSPHLVVRRHDHSAVQRRTRPLAVMAHAPSSPIPGADAAGCPAAAGIRRGVAALVSALALLPLGFVVWVAVQTGWADGVGAGLPAARRRAAGQHRAAGGPARCPSAIVLAVALAWLTERSDLPGARLWAWLAVAPLAVPAFVHSYAWISVVPGLHGLAGGVLVSVLAYFPFLYLPVAAALRRLDPGAGGCRRLARARPLAGVLPRRAAAAAAGDLRRLAAGRPASAGRIRPLRDDPLRHLHHRDRRPVPVDLQRPGRQHAGRRAGALLPRAAGAGGGAARRRALCPRRVRAPRACRERAPARPADAALPAAPCAGHGCWRSACPS